MEKQSVMLDIFQKIKRDILLGEYKPAEKLNIERLKRNYGVSLTPIREALNRLVSIDMVEFVPNKGFRVKPITLDEVVDLYQTWILILKQALALSVEHGDDEWESQILATNHRLEKLQDSADFIAKPDLFEYVSRYRRYHLALLGACPSQWLLKLDAILFDQAERYRFVRFMNVEDFNALLVKKAKAHTQLTKLALKRDADAAAAVIEKSYLDTIAELKRIWPKVQASLA